MNIWKLWMRAATPEEQELMAQAIGTTRGMLYQYSSPESTSRYPSPERAQAIEVQAAKMHRASLGRLPLVYRTDLNDSCRLCTFAQKCLGPAAVRADFPIVTPEMVQDAGGADAAA
jgi:hypothetical protein